MNYFPNNFYGNLNYGNPYQQVSTTTTQNNMNSLLGKIVDGSEVVKATEVPFGGYGVFPKADITEVYIKSWNNDGTTKIITYKPVVEEAKVVEDPNQILLEKIQKIEEKLDNLIVQKPEVEKRKEIKINAY